MIGNRKGFIIDLDGTLYRGGVRLPYAVEFVQAIRNNGCPLLFMTNNSTRRPEEVSDHLQEMGIQAYPHEVFTTSQATVRYLDEQQKGKRVFCVGERGLTSILTDAGYELSEVGVDYVVQGFDREFNYAKLLRAVTLIASGAQSILTNPDVRLPSDSTFLPGAGSIAAAIRTASDQEPTIIGKPSVIMMNYALERMKLSASEIWMVGDNVRTDIAAGNAAGCPTALILTGVSGINEYKRHQLELGKEADYIFATLEAFATHLGLV
ncbi:MAG: HAD-IIA family hydrolase [Paenibacillaceae bacterium]